MSLQFYMGGASENVYAGPPPPAAVDTTHGGGTNFPGLPLPPKPPFPGYSGPVIGSPGALPEAPGGLRPPGGYPGESAPHYAPPLAALGLGHIQTGEPYPGTGAHLAESSLGVK